MIGWSKFTGANGTDEWDASHIARATKNDGSYTIASLLCRYLQAMSSDLPDVFQLEHLRCLCTRCVTRVRWAVSRILRECLGSPITFAVYTHQETTRQAGRSFVPKSTKTGLLHMYIIVYMYIIIYNIYLYIYTYCY